MKRLRIAVLPQTAEANCVSMVCAAKEGLAFGCCVRRVLRGGLVFGLWSVWIGCAASRGFRPGPEKIAAWIEELRRGGEASPSVLGERERMELAQELANARYESTLVIGIREGETGWREVVFVQEEGEWRVDGGLWGLPALDTPERAIAAFHRALAREIELGVGPLLASASRQRWLEEKIRYRDGTALPGAVRIEVRGSQALALTPLGDAIELVKEGGEWRILAIRPYGFQKDLH